jgi:DNA-binding CsgD family transcriptional regulator
MLDDLSPLPSATDQAPSYLTPHIENVGDSERKCDIDPSPNLSDIQLRAIELTVQGHTDSETARILSINRRTIWHWKTHNDDYRQALAEARIYVHDSATDRCRSIAFKATAVLTEILDHPTVTNRMRAAQILLNLAARLKPTTPAPRPPAASDYANWPEPAMDPDKDC